jgi:xanthine dehydrogenase YagS FAD-binding subunit
MRPFGYSFVATVPEAITEIMDRKADLPQVEKNIYLAGGTCVLDLMKLDTLRPDRLVDISKIADDHNTIAVTPEGLRLGAGVRMSVAADHPAVRQNYPVIAQSLMLAASGQIRNMATLGGNVLQRTRCSYYRDPSWAACNKREPGSGCAALSGINRGHAVLGTSADCIATYPGDFAQSLMALDAAVELQSAQGRRVIPFANLHRLPGKTPHLETDLREGEIILGYLIPAGPWTRRSLYLKIRDRQSYAFALASVAVALHLEGSTVREARIALGGVATRPWRAHEVEALLQGKVLDRAVAEQAAASAFAGAITTPQNAYKVKLGQNAIVRALLQAAKLEI